MKPNIAEQVKLESHKLIFHPKRVADWMAGKMIYPLYIEASLSSVCNYRCCFCAYDFVGDKTGFADTAVFKNTLNEVGALGVKKREFFWPGRASLA
jgi:2-iminoacetate synthase ThiH